MTYILLGIFLGGFGIHNFYAKRPGIAIAQLLICVLGAFAFGVGPLAVFIWIIVDLITVKIDGNGVPMTS